MLYEQQQHDAMDFPMHAPTLTRIYNIYCFLLYFCYTDVRHLDYIQHII